jgi:hypothetical protein
MSEEQWVQGTFIGNQPDWLQAMARADPMGDEDIYGSPDGTWTVWVRYCEHDPIHGVPTRAMAEAIVKAMWAMEEAGAFNATCD